VAIGWTISERAAGAGQLDFLRHDANMVRSDSKGTRIMEAKQIPQTIDDSASGWDRALYAFLAENERRSGSRRTVEGYARMLGAELTGSCDY
jgi:hypothetical protein